MFSISSACGSASAVCKGIEVAAHGLAQRNSTGESFGKKTTKMKTTAAGHKFLADAQRRPPLELFLGGVGPPRSDRRRDSQAAEGANPAKAAIAHALEWLPETEAQCTQKLRKLPGNAQPSGSERCGRS